MRPIIQELKEKFSGTDAFIIGGGNSLRSFDFSRLYGRNVIALNSAYKVVDESAILYWGDASWGTKNEAKLRGHPSKYKFSSRINIDSAIKHDMRGPADCYWLKKTGNSGFDSDINHVRGNNTGCQAINFAINLGASRILLLGFDMGYVDGKSHFHDDYTDPSPSINYNEVFIPSIESLQKATQHLPVKIINCFERSRLRCFEFDNVENYL